MKNFDIAKTSEPIGLVYRTRDFSIFKTHPDNRELDPGLSNKIYKNLEKLGWLSGSVVVIDPNGLVYEGHHRVSNAQALQQKGKDVVVEFIIVEEPSKNLVSELNTNTKKWSQMDYIKMYARRGKEDYIKLLQFIKDFPEIPETEAKRFCQNTYSSISNAEMNEGRYVVKDMEKAHKWAMQLTSLKPFFRDDKNEVVEHGYNCCAFVRTFLRVSMRKDFDFNRFFHKIKSLKKGISPHLSIKQYGDLVDEIYNRNISKDKQTRLR